PVGSAPGGRQRMIRSGEQHTGGTVAEETCGDEVGRRAVVTLHREAAELDTDQGDQSGWVTGEVVAGAGQAGCPGDAAESHQRHALDVAAQAGAADESGVE